ncbi:MAG: META domain-containing protein [Caldilineaceae bacterium]|nr:META domain-containing protein [Caldilineaceae bacterium]
MVKLRLMLWLAFMVAACVPPGPGVEMGPPPESPLIPNQVPVLLENQWRLTEIVYNGARRGFISNDPVLVTFHPGILAFRACNSGSLYFDTLGIENANEYRTLSGASTARDCAGGGSEQEAIFVSALRATNRYEIAGDTLILSGEHARVTFVIDNETAKPPDWQ